MTKSGYCYRFSRKFLIFLFLGFGEYERINEFTTASLSFPFYHSNNLSGPSTTLRAVPLPPVQGGVASHQRRLTESCWTHECVHYGFAVFSVLSLRQLIGTLHHATRGSPPSGAGRYALQSVIFDKVRSPHSRIERLCGDDFYFIGLYIFISP